MYRHYQPKERYSLEEARRLISRAFESAAELRRDCDGLPPMTEDGSSPCPFAEQLFYQKDKSAKFVREDLAELRRYQGDAASLARICEHKWQELSQKRSQLNYEAPAVHMRDAEEQLHKEMQQHRQMCTSLKEAISEVEATLREAERRQFPGRKPRGPYGEVVDPQKPAPRLLEEVRKEGVQWAVDRAKHLSRGLDSETGE
jgi:hypothetical protein